MNYLKLKSYAKINLYLKIGQTRQDGYHDIESIMQTINLFDVVFLEKNDNKDIIVQSNNSEVPVDSNSMLYKAAEILLKKIDKGLKIFIDKKIPIAAGLGGGSSNIATVLIGICKLFDYRIKRDELLEIASNFGMDVPFFIIRGTALTRGRGELVFPIQPIDPSTLILLINPGIKISTKWAYRMFDQLNYKETQKNINVEYFLKKSETIKQKEIYSLVHNSFHSVLTQKFPVIEKIKEDLNNYGSKAVAVSGSGATVFGIFEEQKTINKVYHDLKNNYPFVYKTHPVQASKINF